MHVRFFVFVSKNSRTKIWTRDSGGGGDADVAKHDNMKEV